MEKINIVPGRPNSGQFSKQRAALQREAPKPGDGITIHVGTDKTPGTISSVEASGTRFWYTEDTIVRVMGQVASFKSNHAGKKHSAFWYTPPRDPAGWRKVGEPNTRITVGERRYEQDPI